MFVTNIQAQNRQDIFLTAAEYSCLKSMNNISEKKKKKHFTIKIYNNKI